MTYLLFEYLCVTQTAPERHIGLDGVLGERGTSFLAESGTPGQGEKLKPYRAICQSDVNIYRVVWDTIQATVTQEA